MTKGPIIHAPVVVREAFRIGDEIIDANPISGFHFSVETIGGKVYTGCPEEYADNGVLILDCVGGTPTPIIDVAKIAAITVVEV
ncbi:hypothetical protein KEU06_09360 [Pseudaminobacter sp. 19-2017]|uniref:Uncharacterized protein n=1 Tax=Pseudaminobacter soli (ex Zhang et al. 2022) TaxID=2831468 RepID=A0A942I1Z8_9HYPH|nr:hypothetical protein [Pseudaminobacter soli]MBS3648812.1 hypothetical protein [Pseudaminobacter soli]